MKVYDTKDIRNIAFLGHGSTGKTTLAEVCVFNSGASKRMGNIADGNTKSDYLQDEISRTISISSALLQIEYDGRKINIVDTPGYADFVGEAICGLNAVDSSVIVVDAISGFEIGTETAWQLSEKQGKPRIIVINRAGKEHAKAEASLKSIQDRFGINALPIQIPVNSGVGFNKIVDIVSLKEYTYAIDGDGRGTATDITAEFSEQADDLHVKLIEAAAESDDTLMEKFFDSGLTPEEISYGIKHAILNRTLCPVVFTDALTNVGIDLLMKLIVDSAPSPADMPAKIGEKDKADIELKPSNDAPLALQVFKTVVEQHVGELSLFRVFSGSYKAGEELYNSSHASSEKPTLIHNLIGRDRVDLHEINVGDIGTFVKMKHTKTGDTLCLKNMKIKLPYFDFPDPVMDVAVYPKVKGEEDKISQGLLKLRDEDPSFRVRTDPELKQIILEGLGGLHIDVIIDRFHHITGMEVDLKEPKIPYRETITGKSDERYRYKKQTGGRGQYGEVYFRMEPTKRGEGFEFENAIKGGVIPARFIPAVEKGVTEAMVCGPLTKSEVIDLKVSLYFGSFHTVDSSEMAFKMAASHCFKECFLKSKPILLEPIYNIEVKVPDDYTGDVMGDLSSRRGKIMGMEPSGIFQVIKAKVPLADLFKYSTHLRSMTHGSGAYSRSFSHYEIVPSETAHKVIEDAKEKDSKE